MTGRGWMLIVLLIGIAPAEARPRVPRAWLELANERVDLEQVSVRLPAAYRRATPPLLIFRWEQNARGESVAREFCRLRPPRDGKIVCRNLVPRGTGQPWFTLLMQRPGHPPLALEGLGPLGVVRATKIKSGFLLTEWSYARLCRRSSESRTLLCEYRPVYLAGKDR